jgi:hypothetical protein
MADNDGDSDEARMLRPLQAAACTYRIAFGPRAGQKVLTVQGAMPREKGFKGSVNVTQGTTARSPTTAPRQMCHSTNMASHATGIGASAMKATLP